MAKISLLPISNVDSLTAANANFEKIEQELNNKVLYRQNPKGETNTMNNHLDMNGYRIYNLPAPGRDHEAARLKDVKDAIAGRAHAKFTDFDPYDFAVSTNVQGAIYDIVDKINEGVDLDGVNYMGQSLQDKLGETVSIRDFGGRDDDSFDNTAAAIAAKNAVGPLGTILFPKHEPEGVYFFQGDPFFDNVILDVPVNVALRGPLSTIETLYTVRPTKFRYDSPSVQFDWNLTPSFNINKHEKSMWLSDGDLDVSTSKIINTGLASDLVNRQVFFPNSDVIAPTTGFASAGDQIIWSNVSNNGALKMSLTPVVPGDEIAVSFPQTGEYRRTAFIQTTHAYYFVYYDGNGTVPHYGGKVKGSTAFDNGFDYIGRTTPQMAPENAVWSIKIYDTNHFSVLFNGYEVTNIQETFGEIHSAGFGVQNFVGSKTLYTDGWTRHQNKPHGGKQGISVLILGDSMSVRNQGSWEYVFRETLDGSYGIRVNAIRNEAISGDNTTTMRNILLTGGTQGASHVILALGTNDMQFTSPIANVIQNFRDMIFYCKQNFATPIVWIPPLWFTQAQAGGDGQNTQNPGTVHQSQMRSRMMRMCAEMGVKMLDMTNVSGPIVPAYNSNTISASFVRDNIHPTPWGYRLIGNAMAKAVAGSYILPYTKGSRGVRELPLVITQGGWSASVGVEAPYYNKTKEGFITWSGALNAAVVAGNTIIGQLEPHAHPARFVRFPCYTNVVGEWGQVTITDDGFVRAYTPVGTTVMILDHVQYQARYW